MKRTRLATVSAALLALASGGGSANLLTASTAQENRATARETQEAAIGNGATLSVESEGGSITCIAGPAGVVRVEAVKSAPSQAELDNVKFLVEKTADNGVRVAFRRPEGARGNINVDFSITAPADALPRLKTQGGSLSVTGFTRGTQIRTGGGGLLLKNVGGTINAETQGGGIEIEGANGSVYARTGGGNIRAKGKLTGDITLSTGGGGIAVEGIEGTLRARTGGGSIMASGRLRGTSSVETGAGRIEVTVPADSNLNVRAASPVGKVTNEFGLSAAQKTSNIGAELEGRIGTGADGSLTLTTGAGNITLRKN